MIVCNLDRPFLHADPREVCDLAKDNLSAVPSLHAAAAWHWKTAPPSNPGKFNRATRPKDLPGELDLPDGGNAMNEIRLQLKVCEACGVLWLRTGKEEGAYCRQCSARLADFPAPNPAKFCNKRIRPMVDQSATGPRSRRNRCRTSKRPDSRSQNSTAGLQSAGSK